MLCIIINQVIVVKHKAKHHKRQFLLSGLIIHLINLTLALGANSEKITNWNGVTEINLGDKQTFWHNPVNQLLQSRDQFIAYQDTSLGWYVYSYTGEPTIPCSPGLPASKGIYRKGI